MAGLRETNWSFKNGFFFGWAGNPPKGNKVLISKDAQPWMSADQMQKPFVNKEKKFFIALEAWYLLG